MEPMDRFDAGAPDDLAPEDYYFEGETIVFTAAYHVRRGYCCGSGCRHCPYGHCNVPGAGDDQRPAAADAAEPDAG
jgi:hypothetical protein